MKNNYLITSYTSDGHRILGSDCQAILLDCTMIKVKNRIKNMQNMFKFHGATVADIFTFTDIYDTKNHKIIDRINLNIPNNSQTKFDLDFSKSKIGVLMFDEKGKQSGYIETTKKHP